MLSLSFRPSIIDVPPLSPEASGLIISRNELAFWSLESTRISHPSTLEHY